MIPPDESPGLRGVVRQFGFVVPDLDQAIASWLRVGVGPVVRDEAYPTTCSVSRQAMRSHAFVAFANTGDMQIELIHQADETPQHLHRVQCGERWHVQSAGLVGR